MAIPAIVRAERWQDRKMEDWKTLENCLYLPAKDAAVKNGTEEWGGHDATEVSREELGSLSRIGGVAVGQAAGVRPARPVRPRPGVFLP